MVSLQSPHSPNRRATISEPENPMTPQKRKHLESLQTYDFTAGDRHVFEKRAKPEIQNFMADIELHLETPLPSEWQRCLDIQSGKIHFYNTKTHARTSMDPRTSTRTSHDRPNPSHHGHDHHEHEYNHMSLDLELNLTTSESPSVHRQTDHHNNKLNNSAKVKTENKSGAPAWLALETERQEMVATVCVQCHMLVMLCRSSPSCPNCKFVHGQSEKSPSTTSFVQVKL